MPSVTLRPLAERLDDATRACGSMEQLAKAVCATVAQDVGYVFGCFATTDPTGLITWAYKSHPLPIGDEEFARAEYGPPDVNQFTLLAERDVPVGVLSHDTAGWPDTCRRFRTFLAPRFGFTDELRVVFRTRDASWGALALYRGPGDDPFRERDGQLLGATSEVVARAIQRTLFVVDPTSEPGGRGPAVLLLNGRDEDTELTAAARFEIDELGGREPGGSLPSTVLSVAARARTQRTHAATLVRGSSGRWLALRAAPLDGPQDDDRVVVTVDDAPPAELGRLVLAARGLTAREQDVAALVLQGANTAAIAAALYLSPHTVQDHLKAVFAKLGVNSRREMVARLALA